MTLKTKLFLCLLIFLHFSLLVNTRFTLWPEMVVYPYLLNNNFILYRDIVTNYPPIFIYLLSFWSRAFGYQPINFQILAYLIIALIDLLIFLVAGKLFDKKAAFISLLFFVILSIPFNINSLWFDLIVTPFIIAAFYFYIKFLKKTLLTDLFFSLSLLTIAFFVKQQVIWVLIWFLLILVFRFKKNLKFIVPQILASLVPVALLTVFFMFFFAQKNLLNEYIFWNFLFPLSITPPGAGYHELPNYHQALTIIAIFLLFLPALFKKRFEVRLILFVSVILVAFAYRFDFFHLIPSLTILSLAAGFNFKNLTRVGRWFYLVLIPCILIVFSYTARYIVLNWHQPTRFFEQDILTAAKLLEIIDPKNQPVYIQNGPDQLLPLSSRLPPKPWADEFPWYLELQGAQQKIVDSLKMQRVQYVVYTPYETSETFTLGSYRPKIIADYLDANYTNFVKLSEDLSLKKKLIKDDDTKSADKP